MRLLSNFEGWRAASISPVYHIAMFIVALFLIGDENVSIVPVGAVVSSDGEIEGEISAQSITTTFYMTMALHFLLAIAPAV